MTDREATAMARTDDAALAAHDSGRLTADEVVARTSIVREVMERVMKSGVHFGTIPGTNKPSLWQPGAEKLLMTFQLAPELEVEDLSTGDAIRYRIHATAIHVPTGSVVGAGVGEASSDEEKYRWRRAVCEEEFDATPEDRRRVKYGKKRGGKVYTIQQVRTEPADIANTVLKMAKKRALVDLAKSTTAASDVFDQDLEDLADLGVDIGAERDTVAKPRAKGETDDREPGEDDDGPTDLFARARQRWHDKGTITDPQRRRLLAIARGNGWTEDQIVAKLRERLDLEGTDELPWGDPYDAVVEFFQRFEPPTG